jgi:hypothetical protein
MCNWRLLLVREPGRDGVFLVVESSVWHLHAKYPDLRVGFAYLSCRSSPALDELVDEVVARGGKADFLEHPRCVA